MKFFVVGWDSLEFENLLIFVVWLIICCDIGIQACDTIRRVILGEITFESQFILSMNGSTRCFVILMTSELFRE